MSLNPAQRAAVEHLDGPLLVLAGAGSGKTRVVTEKLAWLVARGFPPGELLAITFTNKAAREMRERAAARLRGDAEALTISTFHALGLRLLQAEARFAGLRPGFTVLDADDSLKALKELAPAGISPDNLYWLRQTVSTLKNAGMDPAQALQAAAGPRELQAAELMAWAVCAFPEAPTALKRGLLAILHDELRHMRLYAALLEARGYALGSFPVRDWFWQRVPTVPDMRGFLATLGLGFEGANLDHTRRFAAAFRDAGDPEGAALQDRVGDEEIAHVRFATTWLARFTETPLSLEGWRARLPAPITPLVLRGKPLDRERRMRAGMDDAFLDALEGWEPT